MNLINRQTKKPIIALFALLLTAAFIPSTASAGAKVYVDIPGISIGFHDRHHGKSYRKRSYRNDYYDYRPRKKAYHRDKYYDRRSYKHNYNRNYYRSYNKGYNRSYNRGYSSSYNRNYEYCPTAGYSRYNDRNQSCYEHGDHYHCE